MKRTMNIGKGRSITFDDGDGKKVYESLEDWKAEGERRFGKDILKWRFKCPMCGHVAAVEDFKAAGAKGITGCDIRSIILPLLADHVLREANHYLRLLKKSF